MQAHGITSVDEPNLSPSTRLDPDISPTPLPQFYDPQQRFSPTHDPPHYGHHLLRREPPSLGGENEIYPQGSTPDWTAVDIFATRSYPDPPHNDNGGTPASASIPLPVERELINGFQPNLSEAEARLFRYFVQVWGPLLDATDETRQFSTSIPHLAWTESNSLMYAILALSACQLSRISDYPAQEARLYRTKCARVLVPILLEDPNKVHEASIFATYVLLRVYDHLTGKSFFFRQENYHVKVLSLIVIW